MSAKRGAEYFAENKAYAGLGRASLHSGMIFIAARGANIFVQLASTILLARILSPHDFGLVAMVLALVGFAPMLIDLGTSEASTQKTHITQVEISSLFWLNIAISLGLTMLLIASSQAIASFFGEPSLTGIVLALSVTFVLTAISTSDRAALVIKNCHVRTQKNYDLFGLRHELHIVFEQRENAALDRCHPGMQTQNNPRFHFAFLVWGLVFFVRITDQREDRAIHTSAWLDNMRDESLFRLLVEILKRFTARFLVL